MEDQMLPATTLFDSFNITRDWLRYNTAFTKSVSTETREFLKGNITALKSAYAASKDNPLKLSEAFDVMTHSASLFNIGLLSSSQRLALFGFDLAKEANDALLNTIFNTPGEKLPEFVAREADIMESVANFRNEIEEISPEFGFDFKSKGYNLVHETDCFYLYQVLPTKENVHVNDYKKPVLLVPPYMLGVHILSFLPGDNKSYAHTFANEGIPTYVRVVKDIMTTEKVQKMTMDDDCVQTLELCTVIKQRHRDQKVTLNGTCQGGYICLMNILSGHLTEVVDALITNVAPIDGTYSEAIHGMPRLHSDFITLELPNGNKVANGDLLSLGMRFVAIDKETPLIKVLDSASLRKATNNRPGKTVAALFRWLLKERVHLPLAIANMSTCTFQRPISEDGSLPVKLFGNPLNIGDLDKFGVKWYQCYALKDDLVTPPCATAGNKFLKKGTVESVPFPGGHVAILTSPLNPKHPINGHFVGPDGKPHRGPVAWQLELENQVD